MRLKRIPPQEFGMIWYEVLTVGVPKPNRWDSAPPPTIYRISPTCFTRRYRQDPVLFVPVLRYSAGDSRPASPIWRRDGWGRRSRPDSLRIVPVSFNSPNAIEKSAAHERCQDHTYFRSEKSVRTKASVKSSWRRAMEIGLLVDCPMDFADRSGRQ
jgi:hypothetical protein